MLKDLIVKELKNTLRDKKVLITSILMPVLIFGIMGVIYGFAFGKAAQTVKESVTGLKENAVIYVCDEDTGVFSKLFLNFTSNYAHRAVVVRACSFKDVIQALSEGNYSLAVYIPSNASEDLQELRPIPIKVLIKTDKVSFSSSMALMGILNAFTSGLNSFIRTYIVASRGLNPRVVMSPVIPYAGVIFRGALIPPELLNSLSSSFFLFAFAPLVVISMALGQAASSMAVENEEKTLEVLLSLPIPRYKIVAAKLVGTMVVVILATLSFAAGSGIYAYSLFTSMNSLTSSMSNTSGGSGMFSLNALTSLIDPFTVGALILSTFLSLTAVASLGLLLGSLTPDVRTSSTFVGQLSFLVMIPGFILAFVDLSSLGSSGVALMIALSPFIAPILVLKAYMENLPWITTATLVWTAGFTLLLVYLSSKLIDSERLLTLQHAFMRRRLKASKLFQRKR